jgi:hypothetical protein
MDHIFPQNFGNTNLPQPTPIILPSDPNYQPPTNLLGNPLDVDLFGNVVENKPKRKK